MQRILIATLVAALACLATACGTSSSAGGPGSGTLIVENLATSPGVVDRLTVREEGGLARSFEFDVNLAPGQTHTVTELLPGFYAVDVFWEDGHNDTHPNNLVQQNQTTEVEVMR